MYGPNESFTVFDSMTLYAVKSVTTTALTYAIKQFPNTAAPVPYADMYIKRMLLVQHLIQVQYLQIYLITVIYLEKL